MPVVDPRIAGKPVPKISIEEMERDAVARAEKVTGSDMAFLDQRIPAYEREIINIIGMGVTENPDLRPKIKLGAHGFSVTYVRAPKGCGAALHRHATEEVFIAVHGPWQVFWMEGETERTVDLASGDVVNVPIGIYRGHEGALAYAPADIETSSPQAEIARRLHVNPPLDHVLLAGDRLLAFAEDEADLRKILKRR